MDISQLYKDNVIYIHLKTYGQGIMSYIHLKTRLHPFSFTLGVGIQDFKKSTKLYMKSTKEYKKSTKLAQICPIVITSLLNWLLVYGI
jgi:hypothetical protein